MRKLLRSQTAKRLKKIEADLRRVAHQQNDADPIHDLRVSIRRFIQELRVFRPWFGAGTVKKIRRPLRKLMEQCAAVRNCDVAIEVLRTAGCEQPALMAGLDHERQRTRHQLVGRLEEWQKKDRVRKWRDRLRVGRAGSRESADAYARRLLPVALEDLFRAGRIAALPGSGHQTMHRLRLKAKRVRYTAELFEKVYGSKTKPMLNSLKTLQDKLGAINDCATTLEMIRRDRAAAAAVRQLAGEREREFRMYWHQHFTAREKTRWNAVLGAADRKK
jgi:CHAD domain-containing protein